MITPAYLRRMAAYGRWQNASLSAAAATLDDAARRRDRGAFFGSIHATSCHLLWGDMTWMHRFAGTPKPEKASIVESVDLVADWSDFASRRAAFDEEIVSWAEGVEGHDLAGDLRWWSGAVGREVSRPMGLLVTHFFNHQTHHRGQIHAMLTAAGAKPDDTDLFIMPDDALGPQKTTARTTGAQADAARATAAKTGGDDDDR